MMKIHSIRKSDHFLPTREGGEWVFLFLLALLVSCQHSEQVSPEEEARRDSAALHVALMPVADCFPFYIAQRAGIYEELGLDLRILTLQAQLDTDTALLHRRAEVIYSDLARAIMMQQPDTFDLCAIAASPAELDLMTTRRGRVRTLNQLRERMVAVARHSITDYWSDQIMDSAHMEQTDIFRPQINDVRIRTDMICNGTMDAAFLPEPYSHEARLRGAALNFSTRGLRPRLGAFLIPKWVLSDSTRRHQLRLLFQGYELARARCDSIPSLLRELCHIPDSLIDTIARAMPQPAALGRPAEADAQAALRWLRSRDKIKANYHTDSLIHTDTLLFDFHGSDSIQ